MFPFSELNLIRRPSRRSAHRIEAAEFCVDRLEERVAMVATPVAAQFSAANHVMNNFGVTQILVDGQNPLLDNGFHIIGGKEANNDTQATQINSENPRNSNGKMLVDGDPSKGSIPFSLTFSPVPNDPSKLNFSLSVGPSTTSFASISIPLEGKMQYFSHWRSSIDPLSRYDQNPVVRDYRGGVGNYYYPTPKIGATWGEMIGPKYTVRVTINSSSRPMFLTFVNAPSLSTGDRDVEFSFGAVKAGATASASGTIQVFRTDETLLRPRVYEAEAGPNYANRIGSNSGDGRAATASQVGYLQYGPYLRVDNYAGAAANSTNLSAGKHSVSFRLLVDNNTADNRKLLTVDVVDVATGFQKKLDITRKMFTAANSYQEFTIDFDALPGMNLEFRVYSHGGSYVKLDRITLR